jgi:DNA-binding MarR family transcriptional regulator
MVERPLARRGRLGAIVKAHATAKREAFRSLGEEWRRGNVGRAILDAFNVFEDEVLRQLGQEGFAMVRSVHLNLYRNLDFDGTRLTELALRGNITKQSMQELVDRAEEHGFVERRQDPDDRRAKIVVFSEKGLLLLEALHRAIAAAEDRMIAEIGADAVANITSALRHYVGQRSAVRAQKS